MGWYESDTAGRLWYEEKGEGPVIVLVHGWCKSSLIWRMQIEGLSKHYRVIAPDLAGCGKSGVQLDQINLEAYCADIVALFNMLNLQKALLVGWSQGAQIAIQAFALLRERLSGLVLVSGTPQFTSTADFPHGLSSAEADGMAKKVRRNLPRALSGFNAHMFAKEELHNSLHKEQVLELLLLEPVPLPEIATQGLVALYQADMRPLLAKVDLPTLIVNGDCDQICLPEASTYMAENIVASRHVVFSGCGHAPFLTRADEFNNCISDFFKGSLCFVR